MKVLEVERLGLVDLQQARANHTQRAYLRIAMGARWMVGKSQVTRIWVILLGIFPMRYAMSDLGRSRELSKYNRRRRFDFGAH